jgi:hypothetical protein
MSNRLERDFLILYFSSLFVFLINLVIQGQVFFNYNDSLGLILKMSPIFWIGYLILLILITFQFINFDKLDQRFVFLTLLLLVIYLIGTPFFYEHLARFSDAWSHSYLAQKIYETGRVVNYINSYEEHPGSFLLFGSLFQNFPPYFILKFFVPIFYIIGVIAIYLIFKRFFNAKVSFMASTLYLFFNWTVEDNHLSPQFLVLNLYLVFILALIKFLGASKKDRMPYLFFLFLLVPVVVFSHPLTPIFMILILGSILLLCKKTRSLEFFSVFLFLLLTFIGYTTYNYYKSVYPSLYMIYIERFFDALMSGGYSGATERFATTLPSRILFLSSRVEITIFSLVIGFMGIYLLRKQNHKPEASIFIAWVFSMLLFTIFVALSLKGEFYERFVLISSLPLAAVGAYFINESKISRTIILIILLIISPIYFIAKYGNEGFESLSLEKVNADCFAYKFSDNCVNEQEIIQTEINPYYSHSGFTVSAVSREDVMATSASKNMRQEDVIAGIEKIANDKMLDKIYSSNNAAVYK